MGQLDEPKFEAIVAEGCSTCGSKTVEIRTFLDRRVLLMLADPTDAGRWVHDGEKFIDGTYRIACASPPCKRVLFEDNACPRCNSADALERALHATSRLPIPKRCPSCNELELLALALVPATATYGDGRSLKPTPLSEYGEAGFHMVAFACESCDNAVVTQTCPLCDAPGPLRPRP